MATLTTSLNLGTFNADGTFTDPSAAITSGTALDGDGIKSVLDTRIFYDGNVANVDSTEAVSTLLNANGSITGTDCTYVTGEIVSGDASTTTSGASINFDRSIIMLTRTGGPVRRFNTDGGFNVRDSQIIFSNRDYGNSRLQYNILGSGGVDLTNTTVQPGFRDTGTGAVEFVIRVEPENANLAGLSFGNGVFFQPYAAIPLPQVTFSGIFVATNPALRTVIDIDAGVDVGYVPYWDCSFEAWQTTNQISLQSNGPTFNQQVNLWIVNGVFPQNGSSIIIQGNSGGDGVARSVAAWRPLFSVQPNADARIDFISNPTDVFIKPATTVTLGNTGVPATHVDATSQIPDTSANSTNGYFIQTSAAVGPANNANATLTRALIGTQQVRIWDFANNTPWMTDGLEETPTSDIGDGNAADGTFGEGVGQVIANSVDGLLTQTNVTTAAALVTGDLDDLYTATKARWLNSRLAAPFNNLSLGDEATIEEFINLETAATLDFGSRSVNLVGGTGLILTNTVNTIGLQGTPQLTAGTFFNTIATTGTLTMDNTIASGVSVRAGTLANLPTTLGDGTTWAGTFTTTSATDVTYDMTGADVSELVFINNGTGTVSIVGATDADFDTNPAGTGTILFPFTSTITTDTTGGLTIRTAANTYLTRSGATSYNILSSDLPNGTYQAIVSDAGRAGTVTEFTISGTTTVNLTSQDLAPVGYTTVGVDIGTARVFAKVTYEGRPTIQSTENGGNDFLTNNLQSVRWFGDLWGEELMREVMLDNFVANSFTAQPFTLNAANNVTAINLPIIRALHGATVNGELMFQADPAGAVAIDADYRMTDGISQTINTAPGSGVSNLVNDVSLLTGTIVASTDRAINSINTNTDDEADRIIQEVNDRTEDVGGV